MKYTTAKKKIISRIEWQQTGNIINLQLITNIPKVGVVYTTSSVFAAKGQYSGHAVVDYNPKVRAYRPSKSKKKS